MIESENQRNILSLKLLNTVQQSVSNDNIIRPV